MVLLRLWMLLQMVLLRSIGCCYCYHLALLLHLSLWLLLRLMLQLMLRLRLRVVHLGSQGVFQRQSRGICWICVASERLWQPESLGNCCGQRF
jgi:hypothetical protein